MYRLVLKPRAIKMAKEAFEWYEERQAGLGDIFLKELDRCYNKIEVRPHSFGKIKRDFRQVMMKTFPYVVVFEIINHDAIVYSIFHTSRHPKNKFRR